MRQKQDAYGPVLADLVAVTVNDTVLLVCRVSSSGGGRNRRGGNTGAQSECAPASRAHKTKRLFQSEVARLSQPFPKQYKAPNGRPVQLILAGNIQAKHQAKQNPAVNPRQLV